METTKRRLRRSLIASAAMTGAAMSAASAQTANEAGDVIGNTFTLDYSVGGVAQPGITNDTTAPGGRTVQGTETTFTVDRKVDLDVSSRGDVSGRAPGETDVAMFFTVENQGNDNFQYALTAANRADLDPLSAGEEIDLSSFGIEAVLVADAASCSASVDFSGGALDADGTNNADVAPGGFLCVRVTGDVPTTAADGEDGGVFLIATARQPTSWLNQGVPGALPGLAATVGTALLAATTNTIDDVAQNVFLDGDGPATVDVAIDASHSDLSTVTVSSAALAAAKTVDVFSTDGSGCAVIPGTALTGEQFPVTGACVTYTITVENGGGTNATDIDIADQLPAGVTFAKVAVAGFTGGTVAPTTAATTCTLNASNRCDVSLTGATLAAGATGTITIRAFVN